MSLMPGDWIYNGNGEGEETEDQEMTDPDYDPDLDPSVSIDEDDDELTDIELSELRDLAAAEEAVADADGEGGLQGTGAGGGGGGGGGGVRGGEPIEIGIDPASGSVFVVTNGEPVPIEETDLARMGTIRRLLAAMATRTRRRALGEEDEAEDEDDVLVQGDEEDEGEGYVDEDEDEDDEDDWSGGFWGRGVAGRRPTKFRYRPTEVPDEKGLELVRGGEFGRCPYDSRVGVYKVDRGYDDTLVDVVSRRTGRRRGFDRQDLGDFCLPNSIGTEVAKYDSPVYCGQYSEDGSFFYACTKDFKIHIYDTSLPPYRSSDELPIQNRRRRAARSARSRYLYGSSGMMDDDGKSSLRVVKTIDARHGSWTITDANLSPDNQWMAYSSISNIVCMTKTRDDDAFSGSDEQIELNFSDGSEDWWGRLGIWSLRFSADAREMVAGTNQSSIIVYDVEQRKPVLHLPGHRNDVNAVCFADTASSNVLVSGSDDATIKIWDRRSLRSSFSNVQTKASGVLVGHTEGLTYVSPKGDGRYVVSNGKDQKAMLWDLRMMWGEDQYAKSEASKVRYGIPGFDYRERRYRQPKYPEHPHNRAVMTYKGHEVLGTLIRCHFSPAATTGQRYIYSGSSDGRVHVWNLDGTLARLIDCRRTIPMVSSIQRASAPADDPIEQFTDPLAPDDASKAKKAGSVVVRDVSWHPYLPVITSSTFTSGHRRGGLSMHPWKSGLDAVRG